DNGDVGDVGGLEVGLEVGIVKQDIKLIGHDGDGLLANGHCEDAGQWPKTKLNPLHNSEAENCGEVPHHKLDLTLSSPLTITSTHNPLTFEDAFKTEAFNTVTPSENDQLIQELKARGLTRNGKKAPQFKKGRVPPNKGKKYSLGPHKRPRKTPIRTPESYIRKIYRKTPTT
ncbi:MAG: hypothetical protein ACREQ5_06230, partial [Candidatus Dormibacteria bacterium]